MKADAAALSSTRSRVADLLVLMKVRVNALVVATTAGGYYLASSDAIDVMSLLVTCFGTALVASGAAAINQVSERGTDRLMERTRLRPVADGRMSVSEARVIAVALSVAGLAMLGVAAGALAATVALVTLVVYAVVYTPLKRRTSLSTIVGAVPGALPPLIGWAAVRGSLSDLAPWGLFLIMFVWQMPHFLAIAWMYRDDYARAGLPMLPVVDKAGGVTGRQALLWAATLIPISQIPVQQGLSGAVYSIGALVLGLAQLALAFNFALRRTDTNARLLFYGSITYLPLLWLLMAFGRR